MHLTSALLFSLLNDNSKKISKEELYERKAKLIGLTFLSHFTRTTVGPLVMPLFEQQKVSIGNEIFKQANQAKIKTDQILKTMGNAYNGSPATIIAATLLAQYTINSYCKKNNEGRV